jgi:hypothetical protein
MSNGAICILLQNNGIRLSFENKSELKISGKYIPLATLRRVL